MLGFCLADRDSALPAQSFWSRTGSSPGSQSKDVHRTFPLLHMEEGKPDAILHTAAVIHSEAPGLTALLKFFIYIDRYAFAIGPLIANSHRV